ncbi:MAG: peptide-methionine (S)-S-oxide reductase MsrA [Saprospiraceae bacterium]|jgi:peptide-methionine (S)-S-oxide reductase|nr:peptide-methionine (S)-S-oxide reductase MsrA [Saprospiraceae bacterium]MBP6568405.1 peptide-methionine (S)-S-oxide reductase MsrA [Saprospiraceae bacterium]
MESVYFGAGCFWCVEAVFLRLNGVTEVVSGYMGGHIKNPSYREVCTGSTGHAEVIKVIFDPLVIPFNTLLDVFWTSHDPTTLNRQGADKGTQYRSAIFYTTESQKNDAEKSKSHVATQYWNDPIVTELKPAEVFYLAEDYHQHFYDNNPEQSYCAIVIPPKISKLQQKFSHLLKHN